MTSRDHLPSRPSILIVGAGPAGMMAAMAAAQQGATVVLLEQLRRPGVKLLATGGGRCNLTNTLGRDEFMTRFGRQGRFMAPALEVFDPLALRDFFARRGVPSHSRDGCHVFPVAESAAAVQQALWDGCRQAGVAWCPESKVNDVQVEAGQIRGVITGRDTIAADAVIWAGGGCSYPDLGATGDGYRIFRGLGHTIVEPVPALVPLLVAETWCGTCSGVVLEQASIRIDLPKYPRAGSPGEVLFTHQGLSGPAVLNLSGEVATLLRIRDTVPVRVRLVREEQARQWAALVESERRGEGRRSVRNLLDRFLPLSLADAVTEQVTGDRGLPVSRLSRVQAETLRDWLTGLPLTVTATAGWGKAMITRGGISLKEIQPETLASRIVKGLFFAGEITDLDGPCGGFNLQWAFSSGRLAGMAAAAAVKTH